MVFCDWITISQNFRQKIPQKFSDILLTLDGETGEVVREKGLPIRHTGSYSTSVQIRSNGNRLTLSGNVGRFGRPDNLYGYTVDDNKLLANRMLEENGLPVFTDGEYLRINDTKTYTGAVVSRVDLTRNYSLGNDSRAFMYWLACQKMGRTKTEAWGDGETVYFGKNSKYSVSKCYLKGLEIQHRIKSMSRRKVVDVDHYEYLLKLVEWCAEQGIVRHEVKFAERYLNQHNLKAWHLCTTLSIEAEYMKHANTLLERSTTIDVVEQMPNKVKATYLDYINGVNLRSMSRSKFYAHRNILLQYGIDIAMAPKVHALRVKPKVVTIQPAIMPDFYNLKKVS